MRRIAPIRTLVVAAATTAAIVVVPTAPANADTGGATVAATAVDASTTTSCTTGTGPYQRQVEAHLGLKVDGKNSSTDCRAIRRFQRRYAISPAAGYAGATTYGLVKRFQLAKKRKGLCATATKVVCVDLTSQVMWITENGKQTFGYQPVRSGRDGYETRTGRFEVYRRNIDHVSSIYGSPMPYAMFFSGGMAFHASERYLYEDPGSHGCVHVNLRAIRVMWGRVPVGTEVHVFGHKPGT